MRHGGVVGDGHHLQASHRQAFDGRLRDKTRESTFVSPLCSDQICTQKPEPRPMTPILNVLDAGFLVVNLTESKREKAS